MNAPASISITPVRVADLLAEGERMPVYVHVIDHPDERVLGGKAPSAPRSLNEVRNVPYTAEYLFYRAP